MYHDIPFKGTPSEVLSTKEEGQKTKPFFAICYERSVREGCILQRKRTAENIMPSQGTLGFRRREAKPCGGCKLRNPSAVEVSVEI